jgi:hypothetical protein
MDRHVNFQIGSSAVCSSYARLACCSSSVNGCARDWTRKRSTHCGRACAWLGARQSLGSHGRSNRAAPSSRAYDTACPTARTLSVPYSLLYWIRLAKVLSERTQALPTSFCALLAARSDRPIRNVDLPGRIGLC